MLNTTTKKRGFTIIEVVLVLAIAGLIFLMVFLAFPALQRAQKDTQRRDQLSMLVTQITQYQANNRNRIPTCGNDKGSCVVVPDGDGKITGDSLNGWQTFYKNYLLAQGDIFEDPNGNPYRLQIVGCGVTSGECETQRSGWEFSDSSSSSSSSSGGDSGGSGPGTGKTGNQDYYVLITTNSTCDGENIIYNSGNRRVSVAYKLEGGGTFCANN